MVAHGRPHLKPMGALVSKRVPFPKPIVFAIISFNFRREQSYMLDCIRGIFLFLCRVSTSMHSTPPVGKK